jgi:hypothetical protein
VAWNPSDFGEDPFPDQRYTIYPTQEKDAIKRLVETDRVKEQEEQHAFILNEIEKEWRRRNLSIRSIFSADNELWRV